MALRIDSGVTLSESDSKDTPESTENIIRSALTADESYSGEVVFREHDDKFLRVALFVCQQIPFNSYQRFCDEVYRISFVKLKIDYTKTYLPESFTSDAKKLSVAPWNPDQAVHSADGYPFHPYGSGSGATHRIYVSPVPQHATAVYGHILELSGADKRIKWSKLADYEIVTRCRDLLVVYVSGDDALADMATALQLYQQDNAAHFLNEIPVMTAPLRDLRGVGYAEDLGYLLPGNEVAKYFTAQDEDWQKKHDWIHSDDQTGIVNLSHSQWRAVFILAALRKSGNGGLDALRGNLVTIAIAAGLTPDTMHKRGQITAELVGLIAGVLFPEKEPESDQ